MYGTVARQRVKPGREAELVAQLKEFESLSTPGFVRSTLYRMDADSNEYYMAVVFEDQESYRANAEAPDQDARYQRLRELLEDDPEWHNGEIVYTAE